MRPIDLPTHFELITKKPRPHGTRLRYMSGCKCHPCRAANSRYEAERLAARKAGDWNGLVLTSRARDHIFKLRGQGVGYKRVAIVAGVSKTVIANIISGRKKKIRGRTERKILRVKPTAISQAVLLPAAPFWKLINELRKEFGYSKAHIASLILGKKAKSLQLNQRLITAKNAFRIIRLHEKLTYREPLAKPTITAQSPFVSIKSSLSEAYFS
jgi:hypothetical protein